MKKINWIILGLTIILAAIIVGGAYWLGLDKLEGLEGGAIIFWGPIMGWLLAGRLAYGPLKDVFSKEIGEEKEEKQAKWKSGLDAIPNEKPLIESKECDEDTSKKMSAARLPMLFPLGAVLLAFIPIFVLGFWKNPAVLAVGGLAVLLTASEVWRSTKAWNITACNPGKGYFKLYRDRIKWFPENKETLLRDVRSIDLMNLPDTGGSLLIFNAGTEKIVFPILCNNEWLEYALSYVGFGKIRNDKGILKRWLPKTFERC